MVKVGDRIRIIHLAGEDNRYDGFEGVVENIDSIGQLHGTWGCLAIIPDEDEFEILESNNKSMKTVNKVTLRGRISSVKKIKAGEKEAARFVLGTQHVETYKDGSVRVETEWHNVVGWKKDDMFNLLEDGKTVEVEGIIRYIKYTSAEGVDKVLTEILITDILSVE